MSDGADVLVIGAGGHALVAIEMLRASNHHVIGCIAERAQPSADLARLDVSMLGSEADLEALLDSGLRLVFVAVGDNRARKRLIERILRGGGTLATAVSPAASLSPTALIDPGALVMPGVVVTSQASVGMGAIVNSSAVVEHESVIGPFAHVAPASALAGRVHVGQGALVGVGASVLPGRSIGDWAVVGAGAVVLADVPAGVTVVGNPAGPTSGRPI